MEIAFFHPFDTVAKRLMSNKGSIRRETLGQTAANLNGIIFKKHANDSALGKLVYLYPGSLYAVVYKVFQRVYKFAGQPLVRDHLSKHYRGSFQSIFGDAYKVMEDAVAGCLIGLGEVILLPLDRLKVLSQTNEAAMSQGLFRLLRQEGVRGMYAGTLVTMGRNAPGSFCLFGGTAFTKGYIFGLADYRSATLFQNLCASTVGACLSIAISNPMDVIKTRVQNQTEGHRRSAAAVATSMLKEEGVTSFFKGLTPKIVASAPKLIFAYTMTEFIYTRMNGSK